MIPKPLRELVRQRAQGRCEYCQTSEWLNGLPGEVDHIFPRALGGSTDADNLCFACSSCNGYEQARFRGVDPATGAEVPLFHPRRQVWRDHFTWSQDGAQVTGLTPCGRATVVALHLNHPLIMVARSIWVRTGLHPPTSGL